MRRCKGFTLVEVMVALTLMAVLAGLAWRGIDGMVSARDGTRDAVERTARLNTILAQWQQDLESLHDNGLVPPLAFDGQSLRLTRLQGDSVRLVVWSLHGSSWQRWSSGPITRSADLQQAWLGSQQLLGNEAGQVRLLDDIADWQVYFYRGNAWTNAQSTGDLVAATRRVLPSTPAAPAAAASAPGGAASAADAGDADPDAETPDAAELESMLREALPYGVRLVVSLPAGALTRDIALGPGGR